MKKLSVLALLILLVQPVLAMPAPDAAIIQVHDRDMIDQQRFMYEVINDYNDVENEKARYEKKHSQSEGTSLIKGLFKKKKFVEENGTIKIEAED